MSNLLSTNNKKQVKYEYFLRFLAVALVFLATTMVVLALLSLPSYFLSKSKAQSVSSRIEFLEDYINKRRSSGATAELSIVNEKINILRTPNQINLSKFVHTLLEKKNINIQITSIVLSTNNQDKMFLIGGVARNRDYLLAFSDSLKSVSGFKEVDLPISNLAKNTDIEFNLRIKLNPQR